MNDHNQLLNSIFFPRPTFKPKDEKDHLVEVEKDVYVLSLIHISEPTRPY